MPRLHRRRCFVDRYLFSDTPPPFPHDSPHIPNELVPYISITAHVHELLDHAFPPSNAPPTPPPTLASFKEAVTALDRPIEILLSPVLVSPPTNTNSPFPRLAVEASIPSFFVILLARVLRFRALAHSHSSNARVPEAWLPYLPILCQRSARAVIDDLLITALRVIIVFTNFPETFAFSFARDSRLLPLAFDAMRCSKAVDLSLTLIEEVLSSASERPDFDLSSIPHLPALVNSLGPFQLGSLCRVLAPLLDERDIPFCGGDHCSGACKQSSQTHSTDWHHIEPSAKRLRSRRSYVGASSRVARDRNHASLLAIPGLLEKLVKLISVPPVPTDELALVDHMPRTEMIGAEESWKEFDARIQRAVRDHARGLRGQQSVARARRSMSTSEWLGVEVSPGDQDGILEFTTLIGLARFHPQRFNLANVSRQDEGARGLRTPAEVASAGLGTRDVNVAEIHSQRQAYRQGEARTHHDNEMQAYPHMFFNRLLMSALQVEVLFVLCSLLTGKRKREVQAHLIDAGIFPAMARFCDGLEWFNFGKEKRTEESLKVHLIRLLHYAWDGLDFIPADERLEMLFAQHEREFLKPAGHGYVLRIPCPVLSSASPSSISSQEPVILGMRRLSLTPCEDSSSAQVRGDIETDMELNNPRRQGDERDSRQYTSPLVLKSNTKVAPHGNHEGGRDSASHQGDTAGEKGSAYGPVPGTHEQGIVSKMVGILMGANIDEEAFGTRRYLLAGCMETYLRSASLYEKSIVARHGLLLHLLRQLSNDDRLTPQLTQSRQTSFDLLGQLVKWSRELFELMNEFFRQDPKLLSGLLRAMSESLIDSNVFVRSIVISLECFHEEDELKEHVPNTNFEEKLYDFPSCLLWDFLETNRLRLIQDLLFSVRVEDVNFENICCVNTALILLAVSYKSEDALDMALVHVFDNVLMSVKMEKFGPQHFFDLNPMNIFANFDKLVSFWFDYYQHQSLDIASQELNSNIHFKRLIGVANLLKNRLPLLHSKLREESHVPHQQ